MPEAALASLAGPLRARRPQRGLAGRITVPGDKSISHRALMFGGLAVGETRITGLLEGEDVMRTAAAMRALGAVVERRPGGTDAAGAAWHVRGVGVGGLGEPDDVLDMGNSGTSARLLLGILATHPITTFMTGDASLRRRPMQRVTTPLTRFGARFVTREGGRLPLALTGTAEPLPIAYTLPVPSAQVKSAVLLAGLSAPGETSVIEPEATRDHTERMLRHFGAEVRVVPYEAGGLKITVVGQPELRAADVAVPGDPSSAAFPLVAALLVPGSDVLLAHVGLNPGRIGLIETLREMGADIALQDERVAGGEPVADLRVRHSALRAVTVPPERAPSMIDEYPVLAVASAFAEGTTRMLGLAELKVKESDRLTAVARGLADCGVAVTVGADDSLTVTGAARQRGGASIATALDHRIAMAFLVMGLATDEPVTVDDAEPIATSFPTFATVMGTLGARLEAAA